MCIILSVYEYECVIVLIMSLSVLLKSTCSPRVWTEQVASVQTSMTEKAACSSRVFDLWNRIVAQLDSINGSKVNDCY